MDKAALLRKRREQWERGREISKAVTSSNLSTAPASASSSEDYSSENRNFAMGPRGATAGMGQLADARMLSRLTDRIEQRLRSELQADPHVLRTRQQNLRAQEQAQAAAQEQEDEHTCPVCYEKMVGKARAPTMFFPCGHTFCSSCVRHHMKVNKKVCPICRAPIKTVAVNHHLKNLIEAHSDRVAKVGVGKKDKGVAMVGGLLSTAPTVATTTSVVTGQQGSGGIDMAGTAGSVGGGGAAGARYLRDYNMLVTRRRIMVQEKSETESELRQLKLISRRQADVEEDLLAEEKIAAEAVARAKERLARVRGRIEEQRHVKCDAMEKEQCAHAKLQMLIGTIKGIEADAEKAHVLCEASKQPF